MHLQANTDPNWPEDFKKRREEGLITTSDLFGFSYQLVAGIMFLQEKQVSE
jgi:hypothetical protein